MKSLIYCSNWKWILMLFFGLMLIFISSCKKFVEVNAPRNLILSSTVFSTDATVTAITKGIYSQMINDNIFSGGNNSITFLTALSGDDLINFQGATTSVAFYKNDLNPTIFALNLWADPYKFINNANALIEGLENSTGVSDATKTELLGEAKFIRAFCYFYLVNLFGDVPLVTTTDYRLNAIASRTSKDKVYQQIIADLIEAQSLLADDYSFSNGERVQPNKWAATALLARVYLFTGDWINAETQATSVINNSTYGLVSNLDLVFLKNSEEVIWQLKPIGTSINTNEGLLFITPTGSAPSNASLSNQLLNSFEANDVRKTKWVNSTTVSGTTYYYPFKYKIRQGTPLNEYSMVLRLAEQYLIRSEARAQQNKITEAQADLNIIRNRSGLPNTTANDKTSLLASILHERQVELFTEWGHRWFDLKRTGTVDAEMNVVTPQKGGTWNSYQQLYPIPQSEIARDPNLKQNLGY